MANTGMLGSKITLHVKAPDLTQDRSTQPQAVVSDSTLEFENINRFSDNGGNIVDANIDINKNSISIYYAPYYNGTFSYGKFNGYVFTDTEKK